MNPPAQLGANPLAQLLGTEFFGLFARTVTRLEIRLGVTHLLNRKLLEGFHDEWTLRVMLAQRSGELDPHQQDYWWRLLRLMAPDLCGCKCISYVENSLTADPAIAEHRLLLQYYPANYTGLEFLRSIHMEIYFYNKSITHVWPASGSEDTELGVLMEPEVRHGEAEVYARVQA